MANINRQVKEGTRIAMGPPDKNPNAYCGIFILNTSPRDEALKMMKQRAAINSGLLAIGPLEGYGSATRTESLKASVRIWKTAHGPNTQIC